MLNYRELKERYDEDGFVVVRGFLGPARLSELQGEVQRFCRDVVPSLPTTQAFFHYYPDGRQALRQLHRMSCDPFFQRYRDDREWNELAQALVGESVVASPPMWLNKPADSEHATPPHQDNCAFCLVPPSGTQILLALEPFDEENGCLRYVPGSHRRGPLPHSYTGVRGFSVGLTSFTAADEAQEVCVELAPGDAVCHHPEVVHRALRNRSRTRSRAGFAMTFTGASARVDNEALTSYEENGRKALAAGR